MKIFLITVVCSLSLVLSADELKSFPNSAKETTGRTFTHNVQLTRNKVFLKGFRPITQKGSTCNIYTAIMILRYYHYNMLPRDLKRGAQGHEYSSSNFIKKKLEKNGFDTLLLEPQNKLLFASVIKKAIDNGIPVQWYVNLRLSPVAEERQGDGHARVITGYVHNNSVLTEIIYADSWGRSKNMNKHMTIMSAYKMSDGLHLIFPKDLDKKTKKDLFSMRKTVAKR